MSLKHNFHQPCSSHNEKQAMLSKCVIAAICVRTFCKFIVQIEVFSPYT